jgi:hypothetical protein
LANFRLTLSKLHSELSAFHFRPFKFRRGLAEFSWAVSKFHFELPALRFRPPELCFGVTDFCVVLSKLCFKLPAFCFCFFLIPVCNAQILLALSDFRFALVACEASTGRGFEKMQALGSSVMKRGLAAGFHATFPCPHLAKSGRSVTQLV